MIGSSGVVDVEPDRPVVGVDDGLDAVADVVGVPRQAAVAGQLDVVADALGVRVAARRGVGVDDPQDPPVDDHRVRVAVVGEERRQLRQPVADVADPEHLRRVVDRAGAEHVVVEEGQRERRPAHERRHLHAGRADVVLGLAARAGPLALRRPGDGVAGQAGAEVQLGPRQLDGLVVGLIALQHPPDGRHDQPAAAGVDEVATLPALVRAALEVELAGGDEDLLELAVERRSGRRRGRRSTARPRRRGRCGSATASRSG